MFWWFSMTSAMPSRVTEMCYSTCSSVVYGIIPVQLQICVSRSDHSFGEHHLLFTKWLKQSLKHETEFETNMQQAGFFFFFL